MKRFSARTNNVLVKVSKGRLKKAEAARILRVSRKTLYQWLVVFEKNQAKKRDERNKQKRFRRDVLRVVVARPEYGPDKIGKLLKKKRIKLSSRTVWLILKGLDLETKEKRQAYADDFRKPTQAKDSSYPIHLRLAPEARKRMVEEVLLGDKRVGEVTKRFEVSRKTYVKWKKRYQKADEEDKGLLGALVDQHPEGSDHPRGVSQEGVRAILNEVVKNPGLSSHRLAERLRFVGNHGVQNVLQRNGLSVYEKRAEYAEVEADRREAEVPKGTWDYYINRLKLVWDKFVPSLAPAPPPAPLSKKARRRRFVKYLVSALIATVVLGVGITGWVRMIGGASSGSQAAGLVFASIALSMGSIFFTYSLKYYLTLAVVLSFSQREGEIRSGGESGRRGGLWGWLLGSNGRNGNGNGKKGHQGPIGLEPDLASIKLKRKPMVSIQIPFYNEKEVVGRAIEAAIELEYPSYEIMLLDDSTDETPKIIAKQQKKFLKKGQKLKVTKGKGWTLTEVEIRKGVYLKHLHRTSRKGFKGGALGQALKLMDPRVEMVTVFDADFVPYPDTLELFLKYFKAQNQMKEDYTKSNVAVVQGYQWHVLNKSENWITRGVRSEYAGSYVIERSGAEIYGGLKQISGSVYMIRRDVLEELGWKTSITEDFQLTLRLYEKGYKVVYTPYIQAPAECVSTLKRLIRQRMRWAEGHSQNIKRMFWKLMKTEKLTAAEKFETLYLSPYYLQAFFFLVGTLSWLIAETVFPAKLPFWTVLWGWSLVLTNMISLPLMNAAGMFLEESEEKDYVGLASFVALSYIVVPFQAYAAFKGFIEKEEGPWFRTPKTGKITDVLKRGTFYRFIAGILPGSVEGAEVRAKLGGWLGGKPAYEPAFMNKYMALGTANNQFDGFRIRPRRMKWVGKVVLTVLLAFTVTVYSATKGVPEALATPTNAKQYLTDNASGVITGGGATAWQITNVEDDGASSVAVEIGRNEAAGNTLQFTPGSLNSAAGSMCATPPTGQGFILDTVFEDGSIAGGTWTFYIEELDDDADNVRVGHIDVCVFRTTIALGVPETANLLFQSTGDSTWSTADTVNNSADSITQTTDIQDAFNIGPNEYLYVEYWHHNESKNNKPARNSIIYPRTAGASNSFITTPGITIPENVVYLLAAAPLIPLMALWMRKRRKV